MVLPSALRFRHQPSEDLSLPPIVTNCEELPGSKDENADMLCALEALSYLGPVREGLWEQRVLTSVSG